MQDLETIIEEAFETRSQGFDDKDKINSVVQEIDAGVFGKRGDVLVFLPGERDIRELAKLLRRDTELDILPLYARLSQAEQNRVFDISERRGLRPQPIVRVILDHLSLESSPGQHHSPY